MMDYYIIKNLVYFCSMSVNKCSELSLVQINYYDLTFVLKGTMTYIANGKTYVLHEKDAVLFPPGTLRERKANNEPTQYIAFNFQIQPNRSLPFEFFLPHCMTPIIRHLISIISDMKICSPYHSEEKIVNILNSILFELIDANNIRITNEHVIKIIKYIDENIQKKLSLKTISQQMNLSKEYTSYIFKKELGKTLTNYINEQKLLLARDLIYNYKISLRDVAAHLGYEDYNYFSRIFKKYYGVTPINFKK